MSECKTIKGYGVKKDGSKGNPIFGPKVKYETLYEAQIEVNKTNAKPNIFIKRVAYKCKKCDFYHIGKTTEMLPNKSPRPKRDKFRSLNLKVVGSIDLSQFNKLYNSIKIKPQPVKLTKTEKKAKRTEKKLKKATKSGIVGCVIIDGETWRYYTKEKTTKVITPDGNIKFVKYSKIFYKSRVERASIVKFIEKNHIELRKSI